MNSDNHQKEIEDALNSQKDPFSSDALALLRASKLTDVAKEKYVKDDRGDKENEQVRVRQLQGDGIFFKSKLFGGVFDKMSTFFDSVLWSFYGSEVESAQRAAQKKIEKKDRPKKYRPLPPDEPSDVT